MARRRMVTRTINFTRAHVMTVNVTTAEVAIQEYRINGEYDDKDALLKVLKKTYETDYIKLVNVDNYWNEEVLFGMDENKFMELAEVLPPRTVGIVDTDEE